LIEQDVYPFIHIGPLTLGTYGIMVATGLICAFFVIRADLRRRGYGAEAENIIGTTGLAGLVGARLYHLLETPSEFLAHPFALLFSTMGFAWFGAVIGGFIALVLLARHYQMKILAMLDIASPAAAIGYGIGRIGCLISGDGDYGIPTSLPWGMSFPNGLVPTTERVHPTPIYEFLASMLIGYILWRIGARAVGGLRPAGEVFAYYLILTGVARFLVEIIRINPRSFFGLTNAQTASVASVLAGGFLLLALVRRIRPQTVI
jgi:phosphatidylglycerol:prolipoprotein diacylglycerol transferase